MRSYALIRLAASLLASLTVLGAQAARPLATDDANVNEAGACHLESWAERAGHERAYIVGGACGLGHDLELGLSLTHVHPRNNLIGVLGAGLKWAPSEATLDTAAGALKFGARLDFDTSQPVAGGWEMSGAGAHGLMSLETGHGLELHLNLGVREDKTTHVVSTLVAAGAVWTPVKEWLLFTELQANNHSQAVGGAQRTLGARYWVLLERLGLDVSATRAVGAAVTTWSLGFGWYRIGL